eukprot:12923621-Prorocentrum_lima.AAC.1
MIEVENQIEKGQTWNGNLFRHMRETLLREFGDCCYWEIGLLSGCPLFQPNSRVGGGTHLDNRLTGPIK